MTALTPFTITVPPSTLDDLARRLGETRLLADSPRRPASGMDAAYLRALVETWRSWDWPAHEARLNRVPQYLADVDGTRIHFAHLRSADPDAPALLVMHGWPHTFALQLDFAQLLSDFHVVVPSFPGFGFSPPYADRAVTDHALAQTMHALMTQSLGYRRYLTYGEDVSANVSDLLASRHPEAVLGIVATHPHFPSADERAALTDASERAFFARLAADHETHGAYGHVQATRPDTLAAALNDSPAGLLAWLVEKLGEWSDTPGAEPRRLDQVIDRDRLLTEATIYWVTQSIGTSFRPYYEGADTPEPIAPVSVPAAVIVQRHEDDYPESLARRFYLDLRSFERLEHGGHFTVAERPHEMADRVRAFAGAIGARQR